MATCKYDSVARHSQTRKPYSHNKTLLTQPAFVPVPVCAVHRGHRQSAIGIGMCTAQTLQEAGLVLLILLLEFGDLPLPLRNPNLSVQPAVELTLPLHERIQLSLPVAQSLLRFLHSR